MTALHAIAQFPSLYKQGPGVLAGLPELVQGLNCDKALILAGPNAWAQAGGIFSQHSNLVHHPFTGECTSPEIDNAVHAIQQGGYGAVVGLGGGKVIDTARAAAHLAGCVPFISAPTVASTDAPTSATTVIYQVDGSFSHYLRSRNPTAVLVDTAIIARAPVRFLVAGLGDA